MSEKYKYSDITSRVIGSAMKVHTALGNGLPEVIYQRALEIEMKDKGLLYKREHYLPVYYKNEQVGTKRVDFLVDGVISVELKAVANLKEAHLVQALNYLEILDLEVGLLINFGAKSLQFKRLINKKFKQGLQIKQIE